MQGLAIKLTFARMILIPVFVLVYYWHPFISGQWLALIIYAMAAITDYLDGYLARKYQEMSSFGAFLDPVADKLMVCTVIIVLLQVNPSIWLMICSLIIIGREIWISALREWMASKGERNIVAVSQIGKWKTTVQMIALGFLIFREPIAGIPIEMIGMGLLIIATILTVYSMWIYNFKAYQYLKNKG